MSSLFSIFPKVLYESDSKHSGKLLVIKAGKDLKLIVDGTVQSFNKDSGFASKRVWGTLAKILYKEFPGAKNIFLLGMGAGTMIHMINDRFGETNNQLHFTSVEIDPKIVYVAQKYFELDSIANNTVIIGNAYDVVANPKDFGIEKCFDCVIVDAFMGDRYPKDLKNSQFLENTFNSIEDYGFIIINQIIKKDEQYLVSDFENKLGMYVDKVRIKKVKCPVVSDNYLFYGYKNLNKTK